MDLIAEIYFKNFKIQFLVCIFFVYKYYIDYYILNKINAETIKNNELIEVGKLRINIFSIVYYKYLFYNFIFFL